MSGGYEVKTKTAEKTELRTFKAEMIAKLMWLQKKLAEKYAGNPEKEARIAQLISYLVNKTYALRRYTLPDYVHSFYIASMEFPEFGEVAPSPEVVEGLAGVRMQRKKEPSPRGENPQ